MADVSIKQTGTLTVAYKAMRGAYEQMARGYADLYAWVERFGLQPSGPPLAIFITMPGTTPPDEAEWEVWAPIAGGAGELARDEAGFGVKRIESETIASAMHKGPYELAAPVYETLAAWIPANGYAQVGPYREVYFTGPEVPPEDFLTEVQVPVAKT